MPQIIQIRKGLAAAWISANPVLAVGEPGLETDTNKLKYGDGSTVWTALPYFAPGAASSRNVDGGSPSSTYTTTQNVNGGTPSS